MNSYTNDTRQQERSVRIPWLLRTVGVVGILHAIIGLLASVMMFFVVPKMDKMDPSIYKEKMSEAMKPMLEKMTEEERKGAEGINSKMHEIMTSEGFKSFFYSFSAVGLIFNVALIVVGYQLISLRSRSVRIFVGLMVFYFAYTHGLPRILGSGSGVSDWKMNFDAAWGVGNLGIGLMLTSYYWLWGSLLALIARGFSSSTQESRI
jgi:hypothetical protein